MATRSTGAEPSHPSFFDRLFRPAKVREYAETLAEEKATALRREIGWDGIPRWGGAFSSEHTEHNPKLEGEAWRGDSSTIGVGHKMFREDPIIRAIVLSYIAPLLDATWELEPAEVNEPTAKAKDGTAGKAKDAPDDEDDEKGGNDKQNGVIGEPVNPDRALAESIADAAKRMLIDRPGWQKTIRDALLSIRDGVRLQEIVATYDTEFEVYDFDQAEPEKPVKKIGADGEEEEVPPPKRSTKLEKQTTSKKGLFTFELRPRLPHSIDRWKTNPDGSFGGIIQVHRDDDTGRSDQAEIPASKLLMFVCQGEGENWLGEPFIRPCWGAYHARREILKQTINFVMRWGPGIPIVEQQEAGVVTDDQLEKALTVAERMRSTEYERIFMPWPLKLSTLEAPSDAVRDLVEMYDALGREMARACACMHLYTGDNSGSYALMEEQTSLFMLNINHVGAVFCEEVNELLRRWCRWNGWDEDLAPKLQYADLQAKSMADIADMLVKAKNAGVLTTDREDEEWFRDQAGLPEMSEASKERWNTKAVVQADQAANPNPFGGQPGQPPQPPGKNGAPQPPGSPPPPTPSRGSPASKLAEGRFAKEALDKFASQSPDEKVAALKRFGILDEYGALAEPYRSGRFDSPLEYARSLGPAHLLAESYFSAEMSRQGREAKIQATARGARAIVQRIASQYAEDLANAKTMKQASRVQLRGMNDLADFLAEMYLDVEDQGKTEVQAEIEAQRRDPEYPQKFAEAFALLSEADRALLATKPGKVEINDEEIDLDDYREGVAATSADAISAQVRQAGTAAKQASPSAGVQEIAERIASVVTDRVIERQIIPDANGVYANGRMAQVREEDVPYGVYTTSPELGVNGPHDPCDVCMDTAGGSFSPNPFKTDGSEPFLETPNPGCDSTQGPYNYCWCTIIGLSQPPEGTR